jgi:hypothetical protein
MVYFPDENLCDGYAELVSEGFFDVDNVPAHDTWVSFFERWLAQGLPDAAQLGVGVEQSDGIGMNCSLVSSRASLPRAPTAAEAPRDSCSAPRI